MCKVRGEGVGCADDASDHGISQQDSSEESIDGTAQPTCRKRAKERQRQEKLEMWYSR